MDRLAPWDLPNGPLIPGVVQPLALGSCRFPTSINISSGTNNYTYPAEFQHRAWILPNSASIVISG